jgi:hypothetical protein
MSTGAWFVARGLAAAVLLVSAGASFALDSSVPPGGLPSAALFSSTLLPERGDVIPWQTLAKVEAVQRNGRMVPEFTSDILALDKRAARVQGFMIPLDVGDKQKHFLLAAVPAHCPFCLPAGPDAIVEIQATSAVSYTFEPLVMSGQFAVLRDDPAGVLYRLTGATQIEAAASPARSSTTLR